MPGVPAATANRPGKSPPQAGKPAASPFGDLPDQAVFLYDIDLQHSYLYYSFNAIFITMMIYLCSTYIKKFLRRATVLLCGVLNVTLKSRDYPDYPLAIISPYFCLQSAI